jgi:D-amino-acid dehydrogenase
MHIAVLGAGVVGVTTAWYLADAGHDVTIIDRNEDVAAACSHANGAQLSYSYVDAMASPAFLLRTPGLLAGIDRAIRVRPPLTLDFIRWGLNFVRECTHKHAAENTLANLELAQRSKVLLDGLRQQLPGDFGFRNAGKLVLLRKPGDLDTARAASELKTEMGCPADVISMQQAMEVEPAISHMSEDYVGAVYSPGDDVGDARVFTRLLGDKLRLQPQCRFVLGTEVDGLIVEANELKGVATSHGLLDVDAAVVCLGSWSPTVLGPLGIDIPICPTRGYSVTLEPGEHPASVSVTDFGRRFVISRLGDQIRIAGFADFVGFKTGQDQQRVDDLVATARANAPFAARYSTTSNSAWGGFRPLTPNGRPLTGATRVRRVYMNTGHGSFGWTLACGSAERIARQVTQAPDTALAA